MLHIHCSMHMIVHTCYIYEHVQCTCIMCVYISALACCTCGACFVHGMCVCKHAGVHVYRYALIVHCAPKKTFYTVVTKY